MPGWGILFFTRYSFWWEQSSPNTWWGYDVEIWNFQRRHCKYIFTFAVLKAKMAALKPITQQFQRNSQQKRLSSLLYLSLLLLHFKGAGCQDQPFPFVSCIMQLRSLLHCTITGSDSWNWSMWQPTHSWFGEKTSPRRDDAAASILIKVVGGEALVASRRSSLRLLCWRWTRPCVADFLEWREEAFVEFLFWWQQTTLFTLIITQKHLFSRGKRTVSFRNSANFLRTGTEFHGLVEIYKTRPPF